MGAMCVGDGIDGASAEARGAFAKVASADVHVPPKGALLQPSIT